jgi:hypothetical protein
LKEKSRSFLNLRRLHTRWSGPYSFVELRLQVVVVGLPLLAVYEVAGADRKVATLLELTETPHVAVGPVLVR